MKPEKPNPARNGVPHEYRFVEVRAEGVDVSARTVELAFSSELAVQRWWGSEILDHSPASVRLGRLAGGRHPLLVEHSPRDQVGVVERAWIGDDRVARAIVRFGKSARAEEIFQDVVDHIRSLVSVGYAIHGAVLERTSDTDGDVYRINDWEPFEVSIVAIPADPNVGLGRTPETEILMRSFLATTTTKVNPMIEAETRGLPAAQATPAVAESRATPATVDVQQLTHQAREGEVARIREIEAMGQHFGMADRAREAVQKGESAEAFRKAVMDKLQADAPKQASQRNIGLSDKELGQYSVSRAIMALLPNVDAKRVAPFEAECHEAMLASGRKAEHNGILIPHDVLSRQLLQLDIRRLARTDPEGAQLALRTLQGIQTGQRDIGVTPGSAGGFLVQTTNQAASFIDLLRARARVVQLGAIVLPGLRDSVTIPRQTAAATFNWLATETTAITESQQTFGQVAMTPKNGGAYVEISMQLMKQSNPAADMIVMNDLARVSALAVDAAALNGSGAGGQPTGVLNTGGIGNVVGTTLGWTGIVEFETDVSAANADVESMAYLTTPAVRGLLKTREKAATTGNFVWGGVVGDSMVNGYQGLVTTQLPAASMLFGDFSQIVIGEWGTLEISLNPFANFAAGIIGIRSWVSVDVGIRQPTAFSAATTIT
jgi:HK97 family phage major capsid protein